MKYTNYLFFYLKRYLLIIEITVFSIIMSRSLISAIIPFVAKLINPEIEFGENLTHISVFGWILIAIFMLIISFHDGKNDMAYEKPNLIISIVGYVGLFIVYTLPSQLLNVFVSSSTVTPNKIVSIFYDSANWLAIGSINQANASIISSVILFLLVILAYYLGVTVRRRKYQRYSKHSMS